MTNEPRDTINGRPLRTQAIARYCGPCGEYYHDGDVWDMPSCSVTADYGSLTGKECPGCEEIAPTVDDIAEQQAEDAAVSFHDGGSSTWRMIKAGRK